MGISVFQLQKTFTISEKNNHHIIVSIFWTQLSQKSGYLFHAYSLLLRPQSKVDDPKEICENIEVFEYIS